MDNKKKILIIHPEGNIYNNPNLYEVLRLLSQNYDMNILIPKLEINKTCISFKPYTIEYNKLFTKLKHKITNRFFYTLLTYCFDKLYIKKKYDLIIGVDRWGILDAYFLSKRSQIPYAHISYEIIFSKEVSTCFKNLEIEASKNVKFSVVQDPIRGEKLHDENGIDLNKMIYIPVASSFYKSYKKNYSLYKELNIPLDMKILIFVGSISEWSCIDDVLQEADLLPHDWVIVFHDRYGDAEKKIALLVAENRISYNAKNKIYFSYKIIDTNEEMHLLLHSADIGLALYCPDYKNMYTGNNLKYIGLASGKISTYLQNGLPIITFADSIYGEFTQTNDLGIAIDNISQLWENLHTFELDDLRNKRCLEFFKSKISFENYELPFLKRIEYSICDTNEKDDMPLQRSKVCMVENKARGLRTQAHFKKSYPDKPLISIITVVYNGAKYLEDTILSVLNQTYDNVEYIIIDGASTDGTLDIIRKYEHAIDYWISEKDKGIYDAWNKGVIISAGDWIGFLGADDLYLPDALQQYIERINLVKEIEYISARNILCNDNLDPIRTIGSRWDYKIFSNFMNIAHVGSLHHKTLFERYGLYDTSFKICGDYELLLRPASTLKAEYLELITCYMRNGGISNHSLAPLKEAHKAKILHGKQPIIAYLQMYLAIIKQYIRQKVWY